MVQPEEEAESAPSTRFCLLRTQRKRIELATVAGESNRRVAQFNPSDRRIWHDWVQRLRRWLLFEAECVLGGCDFRAPYSTMKTIGSVSYFLSMRCFIAKKSFAPHSVNKE
mmetsp:Transcript_12236/g.28321  ORF Transcript_12236/g.28321 Transcript_12236/m.28321 type:complete len:111 (-) Transcript_12236:852-1184(-)